MSRLEMYRLLELSGDATLEDLKQAYRKLAKRYHPDLTRDNRDGEHFAKIVNAYKTLIVTVKRRSLIDFPVRETRKSSPPYVRPSTEKTPTQGTGTRKTPAPGEADIFSLGKLLVEGKTTGIRVFAARGLGNAGKRSAYPFLRKALYDTDALVIKSAIESIGKLRIQQCAGELGAVFMRGDHEIKREILVAVSRIGLRGDFHNIVTAAMKDTDPEIRKLSLKLYSAAV